ncbi:hypothetical protein M8818_002448 [Zalaria obscura]|uniref:Uncharacterized protein n=1 Tax=Zalaria obscura TaxID=2024903 RepID=A0ACC3SI70_9PEZI
MFDYMSRLRLAAMARLKLSSEASGEDRNLRVFIGHSAILKNLTRTLLANVTDLESALIAITSRDHKIEVGYDMGAESGTSGATIVVEEQEIVPDAKEAEESV